VRRSQIADTRERWKKIDDQELERIKDKMRCRPPQALEEFEVKILLHHIDSRQMKTKIGAPAVLSEPHRFMAIHYWWLCKNGKARHARKKVGQKWGVSEKTVDKYAAEYETAAIEYVREAQAKSEANPDLHPKWVVEQLMELLADGFKKLDE